MCRGCVKAFKGKSISLGQGDELLAQGVNNISWVDETLTYTQKMLYLMSYSIKMNRTSSNNNFLECFYFLLNITSACFES